MRKHYQNREDLKKNTTRNSSVFGNACALPKTLEHVKGYCHC